MLWLTSFAGDSEPLRDPFRFALPFFVSFFYLASVSEFLVFFPPPLSPYDPLTDDNATKSPV